MIQPCSLDLGPMLAKMAPGGLRHIAWDLRCAELGPKLRCACDPAVFTGASAARRLS